MGGRPGVGPGGEVTTAGEVHHHRVWSGAVAFGTTLGPVWFKVNAAGTRHEPRLHRHLARLVPELVPDLLAVDEQRGWSLQRDAGPTLRVLAAPADQETGGCGCCPATPRPS